MTNSEEVKKVISIYKIDLTLLEDVEELSDFEKVVKYIKAYRKYRPTEILLKNSFMNEYNKKCFKLENSYEVGWKKFVENFTEDILDLKQTNNSTIILLIQSKDDNKNIFAITFGPLAYPTIQNIIDVEFGIDLISRFINPNDNILKSSKGQNAVGSTQGQMSIYRQLHSLNDIEDFGKIFQELNISIDKDILEKFGIKTEKTFKNCCAKSSFQIKTSILPQMIEKYIKGCEYSLTLPKQPINNSKIIDKRTDPELYNIVKDGAINKIWNDIQSDGIKYDLCHKDFDKYFQADYYKMKYNRHNSDMEVDSTLLDILPEDVTQDNFKNFLEKARIESYNESGEIATKDNIFKHLFVEYTVISHEKEHKYFILNGIIYKLEESFLKSLNSRIQNFQYRDLYDKSTEINNWENNLDEDNYNKSFIGKENFVVFHPFKNKFIELCDFIRIDGDDLFLYFVKDGFSATVRDLAYQIYTTAKIIENNKNSDYSDIESYCRNYKDNPSYSQRTSLSVEELVELFKTKNLKYVFTFRDVGNRSLQDNPKLFQSNIAKFALIDLVYKMNSLEKSTLLIKQVKCS